MNKIIYALIFIVLISCGDDNNTSPNSKNGVFKGTAYDMTTDTVLPNVFISTEPPTEVIKSDENGEFEFNNVPAGEYKLSAERNLFHSAVEKFTVNEGKITTVEIAMIPLSVNNTPPDSPTLIHPKDESNIYSKNIRFLWSSKDEDQDELSYDLYFGNSKDNLSLKESNISANNINLNLDLKEGKTYYWKVVVKDLYFSIESEIFDFTFIEELSVDIDNLIGYWPLNGDALDYSGNNYHGEIQNTNFVEDRLGNSNSAAHFKGNRSTNSKILIKETKPFDVGSSFTIAAWVKQDVSMGENSGVGFFEFVSRWGGSGSGAASYAVGVNKFRRFYLTTFSNNNDFTESNQLINQETWYHLCATFDNGRALLYVNGELSKTDNLPIPQNSNLNFSIGARPDQLSSFHGVVDEVYLIDRAISSDEVNLIMNN